jgi:hypothetical protein
MWFLHRKVLFNKDNLAKRNWVGCTKCVFVIKYVHIGNDEYFKCAKSQFEIRYKCTHNNKKLQTWVCDLERDFLNSESKPSTAAFSSCLCCFQIPRLGLEEESHINYFFLRSLYTKYFRLKYCMFKLYIII